MNCEDLEVFATINCERFTLFVYSDLRTSPSRPLLSIQSHPSDLSLRMRYGSVESTSGSPPCSFSDLFKVEVKVRGLTIVERRGETGTSERNI